MGDRLCLDIVVANHGSCDVWVRRVECLMMNSNYDKHCVTSVADVVCRGQRETFSFQFNPDPEDVGKLVKMDEVHVTVGSDRFNIVVKKSFAGDAATGDAETAVVAGGTPLALGTPFGRDAANLAGGPRTRVVPRESQMEVEFRHAAPALVGEWYRLGVDLVSREGGEAAGLEVAAWIRDREDPIIGDTTQLTLDWNAPEPGTPLTPEG